MKFDRRETGLRERMDDPDCNLGLLRNTYRQFTLVNRLLVGWKRMYRQFIRPALRDPTRIYSLLDIGCGGGGTLLYLQRRAKIDGFRLTLTGIDTDPRSIAYVCERSWPEGISFRRCSSSHLVEEGLQFDFVVCNHVLHHLTDEEVNRLLDEVIRLTGEVALLSDAIRSRMAYVLFFLVTAPLFRNSFIVEDGLISIRRSFQPSELRALVSPGWELITCFPYRQCLVYRELDRAR